MIDTAGLQPALAQLAAQEEAREAWALVVAGHNRVAGQDSLAAIAGQTQLGILRRSYGVPTRGESVARYLRQPLGTLVVERA